MVQKKNQNKLYTERRKIYMVIQYPNFFQQVNSNR